MLGDIDDLIRSNQGERSIISDTIATLVDSALDVADLSVKEGDLSSAQRKAIDGLEAGLVKLIKSDIILEHNVTELMKIREKIKRSAKDDDDDDDDDDQDEMGKEEEIAFEPAPVPTLDEIKKHEKYKEFYKRVWKKDLGKGSGDDGSDDDDDLAVVGNQMSLTCPITKKPFERPVKKYTIFYYHIFIFLFISMFGNHLTDVIVIARTVVTLTRVMQSLSTSVPTIETLRRALLLGAAPM